MKPELYETHEALDSVIHFLTSTLTELGWNEGREEVVMDVGCGPANITTKWILPLFSDLTKLIAVDALPSMIELAKAMYPHPKVEYHVVNFEDKSTTEHWNGQVTKLVSVHCFNWLKDQKKAFQTVYNLLKPGGEAAFYFVLQSDFYAATVDITEDPKWQKCFENIDSWVPESHLKRYNFLHYQKIVEDIGYSIIICQDEMKVNALSSDEKAKDLYYSISALVPHVPPSRREEFKNDLYYYVIKHGGRSEDGTSVHRALTLELVLRKPK